MHMARLYKLFSIAVTDKIAALLCMKVLTGSTYYTLLTVLVC